MKVETLTIDHPRMPAFTIRQTRYRTISAHPSEKFQIELTGHGVEVCRNLDLQDILAIREWCNAAIAADVSDEHMQAAE